MESIIFFKDLLKNRGQTIRKIDNSKSKDKSSLSSSQMNS